ncbi:carbohydrate ABC transporter permease [Notoacmeibacter sp. MSK16QG-6]|uniref:carbohydrate ABC transporter permease n=1 Tax=Notoacmeibacter sp. MSK16QG-6 TaxID=2957982 RepID=UPI0020A125D3|nr:carbohydrate ABC transporter permease [Notoacmeibacter sp. MSK16QG-6]MCP1200462.1 carbohydrate ABC transporter permease [Notoacmeibacter sp. MSK16QG-6]
MGFNSRTTPFERVEYVLILSALFLMVVVTIQPILHLVAVSFSEPANVPGMSGLEIVPDGFSLQVWSLLIQNPNVQRGLLNALYITIVGTAINIVATTLMAWALAQTRLPGRKYILLFVLVTIVFDPGIVPDFFVMKNLGLLNSYWSVILYRAVFAWYLIILIRLFEEVPSELLEAAELDGANPFQTLWHVVVPVARSSIAMIGLFYLVLHWNEFFRAMIYLNDPNKWPLQVVLRQFVVEGDKLSMVGLSNMSNYTEASQISIRALKAGMIALTIAPLVLIYPFVLKFFTKGTMSGAVKG